MDAQTRLDPRVKEFMATVQGLVNRIARGVPGQRPDLRAVELELRRATQALAHEATEILVSTYGTGREGNQRPCECGGSQQFKAIHKKK